MSSSGTSSSSEMTSRAMGSKWSRLVLISGLQRHIGHSQPLLAPIARTLHDQGMPLRDVGRIMGVSHQEAVAHLLAERGGQA